MHKSYYLVFVGILFFGCRVKNLGDLINPSTTSPVNRVACFYLPAPNDCWRRADDNTIENIKSICKTLSPLRTDDTSVGPKLPRFDLIGKVLLEDGSLLEVYATVDCRLLLFTFPNGSDIFRVDDSSTELLGMIKSNAHLAIR